MPRLLQLTKNGVTVIKPENKVSTFTSRGFTIDGEIDQKTGKLKVSAKPKKADAEKEE